MKPELTRMGWAAIFATATVALGSTGCTTNAFCFSDCGGGSTTTTGQGGGTTTTSHQGGSGGECLFGQCGSTSSSSSSGGGGPPCEPSNGGIEKCDGADNDCNGTIDDVAGLDLADPKTCGTCSNNCYAVVGSNWDPATIQCTPPATPGAPGACDGTCTADYFDLNSDGLCEYYCQKSTSDDSLCNNKDDDCDGLTDEDVDKCTSTTDCGACGKNCSLPHATPVCVHTGAAACDPTNTQCQIQACTCAGAGDCWWDLDKSAATGCEYPCFPTGAEVCGDGVDNDCDGLIDEADDLSQDPQIGVVCHGGTLGTCAEAAHAGTTACVSHQVTCVGVNVLHPGEQAETCNNADDDCDGAIDDSPTDIGAACGGGSFFPCQKGNIQCQGGTKVCVGAIDPALETCDGIDNDCDGTPDNNLPAAQSGAPCNVPPAAPPGATSPCQAGVTACVGGTVQCAGSIGPQSPSDTCGVDANCDGQLTNQPAPTDVHNCGACGNDCLAGSVHANWACVPSGASYQCQFQGCQAGYYDLNNDQQCEYPCVFVSAQETCNGKDDNCNGQIDEAASLVAPSITQVCGVSPGATAAECSPYNAATNPAGVSLACTAGAWQCTFHTTGVCNPTCAAASEVCETTGTPRDNDCDGLVNENTPNYGQPCASDDGLPAPGHGACRTTGTFVCATATTTGCSATKDNTKASAELCDGADNDCDGLVDEVFSAKGTNTTHFVKPSVTKIASSLWVYSYEASRPSATAVVAGTGNGYRCNTSPCPGSAPAAPTGVPLDKTPSCSVQGKIPWFNVTPIEAEQTCNGMGGRLCTLTDWQTACRTNPPSSTTCQWGYAPLGASCTTALGPPYAMPFPTSGSKYCNLGATYDFSAATGDQDGLLPTGSSLLKNCWADWTGLLSNGTTSGKIFDITGNLREITKDTSATPAVYRLMGGAFDTPDEAGATCNFTFYTTDQGFQLYDLGFRCCFTSDPTL